MARAIMSELFPTQLRGLDIGAWYNVTVTVFGVTASLVLGLFTAAGSASSLFWYVSVVTLITVVTTLHETKGTDLS